MSVLVEELFAEFCANGIALMHKIHASANFICVTFISAAARENEIYHISCFQDIKVFIALRDIISPLQHAFQ